MTGERGRPRGFDIETALDRALDVFWRCGFHSASVHMLTAAIGVSKPSLYAAFGDKESLYLKALERYVNRIIQDHASLLAEEPDCFRALERFLLSLAQMLTNPALPGGCFIITGTADCGSESLPAKVEHALRVALGGSETYLKERLLRAQQEGQLTAEDSAEDLAALYCSLVAGLAVQAKSGASEAKLRRVIKAAITNWQRREPPM